MDFSGTSVHLAAMMKFLELGHIVNNQSALHSFSSSESQDDGVGKSQCLVRIPSMCSHIAEARGRPAQPVIRPPVHPGRTARSIIFTDLIF